MNRRLFIGLALPALLVGPVTAQQVDVHPAALAQSRAEWRAAEADAKRLEAEAGKARDKAGKLAAERRAAAAALIAAEAEISALGDELAARRQSASRARERLQARQAPVAALVAGIINMGRRPPILAVADSRSMDELVHTRILIDTILPLIRARTAGLSAALAEQERLVEGTKGAAARLAEAHKLLQSKQERFAILELEAESTARSLGSEAIDAGDRVVAARDAAGRLGDEAQSNAEARENARALAKLATLPPRPSPDDPRMRVDAGPQYELPAHARLIDGLGSINRDGVRTRGVHLATPRGAAVVAPAKGVVVFSGPYRRHDGVIILDHGGGYMTMLVGVRGDVDKGTRVNKGAPIGRALGEISIEYSRDGRPMSAPIAAVRSLSIQGKPR